MCKTTEIKATRLNLKQLDSKHEHNTQSTGKFVYIHIFVDPYVRTFARIVVVVGSNPPGITFYTNS